MDAKAIPGSVRSVPVKSFLERMVRFGATSCGHAVGMTWPDAGNPRAGGCGRGDAARAPAGAASRVATIKAAIRHARRAVFLR